MSDFFSYSASPTSPGDRESHPILGDLSGEDWEKFIGYAARRRYPAGAPIVEAGDRSRVLCFIASGQVRLRAGNGPVRTRGEGEVFGLLSFLDGAPSAVSVTVAPDAPAELLMLSSEALSQLAAWQPRIAMALLRDLGEHLATRLRRLQAED